MMNNHVNHAHSWAVPLGRILLSLIFLISGFGKIMNFEGTVGFMQTVGIPFTALALVIAIILELGGALLLILGWKVRWGALSLILFTVLSTLFFHLELSDQTQLIAFLKNLGLVGGLLYVTAVGAGAWSIDHKHGHKEAGQEN